MLPCTFFSCLMFSSPALSTPVTYCQNYLSNCCKTYNMLYSAFTCFNAPIFPTVFGRLFETNFIFIFPNLLPYWYFLPSSFPTVSFATCTFFSVLKVFSYWCNLKSCLTRCILTIFFNVNSFVWKEILSFGCVLISVWNLCVYEGELHMDYFSFHCF